MWVLDFAVNGCECLVCGGRTNFNIEPVHSCHRSSSGSGANNVLLQTRSGMTRFAPRYYCRKVPIGNLSEGAKAYRLLSEQMPANASPTDPSRSQSGFAGGLPVARRNASRSSSLVTACLIVCVRVRGRENPNQIRFAPGGLCRFAVCGARRDPDSPTAGPTALQSTRAVKVPRPHPLSHSRRALWRFQHTCSTCSTPSARGWAPGKPSVSGCIRGLPARADGRTVRTQFGISV